MFFQHFDEDDDTEVGADSIVNDEDRDTSIEESPWYQTYWDNIVGVWGAIERTFDAMHDPYAADTDITISDQATKNIIDDYKKLIYEKFKDYDINDECCSLTGMNVEMCGAEGSQYECSELSDTAGSQSPTEKVGAQTTSGPLVRMGTAESGGTLDSSVSQGTIKKSIQKIIEDAIKKEKAAAIEEKEDATEESEKEDATEEAEKEDATEEAESDSESEDKIEFQSVATTILSKRFKIEKIDVGKLLAGGDASKVYKLIAAILYQQNVVIDVRNGASRGKSNEGQMKEVWGTLITNYAKGADAKCYLCGGQIVPCKPPTREGERQGGQPEMEHKLPCAVFYAKFVFIYTCFANELTQWRTYVAKLLPEKDNFKGLKDYYILMNSSAEPFNKPKLDGMYDKIKTNFLGSFDKSTFDQTRLDLFTGFILPAYLSEFAYSHHVCNQLKSNHDLSNLTNLDNYYIGLEKILDMSGEKCNKTASTGILQPACINDGICDEERAAINAGLSGKIASRKANVRAQMESLDVYATAYAIESQTTEKRMILHTIKETIKTMKVPTLKGKITKKATKLMNAQAREVAQDLQPIMEEADRFLDQLNKDTIYPNLRARSLDSAKERVRAYLDRMEEIFGNAYDTPSNIASQLKNPHVSPKTKLRIYDNTSSYYKILNAILTNINSKMRALNIQYVSNDADKENGAIIDECTEFIKSLYQMLEKYGKKIPEWKRLEQSALEAQADAPTDAAATMKDNSEINPELNMAQQKAEQQYDSDDELPPYVPGAASGRTTPSNITGRMTPTEMRSDAKLMYGKDARGEIVDAKRSGYMSPGPGPGAKGGRTRQVRKTRKLKRRPRKTTKRGGRGNRSMKRKYRSRKNTRRR
jgi:hypothetical protein